MSHELDHFFPEYLLIFQRPIYNHTLKKLHPNPVLLYDSTQKLADLVLKHLPLLRLVRRFINTPLVTTGLVRRAFFAERGQ